MPPSTYLDRIVEAKQKRLEQTRSQHSLEDVRASAIARRLSASPYRFRKAIESSERVNIIAEFKRASPSKGLINGDASAAEVARLYEAGGAAALSVLTEADFFRGSLEDLVEVKRTVSLPVLRKDFIFESFQVYEAAAFGADAVLLIVASLSDRQLLDLRAVAEDELGLDTLVEVHTKDEMSRAVSTGAKIIGVNNRNLQTFDVSLDVSVSLAHLAPAGTILVSESGIHDIADICLLKSHGYNAFLIGEALMRSLEPQSELRKLTGVEARQ